MVPLPAPTSRTRLRRYGDAMEKIQSRYRGAPASTSSTRPSVGECLSVTGGVSSWGIVMLVCDRLPAGFGRPVGDR